MDNNNLINEINKLKALIATLQQQLQTQQTEINLVKETALDAKAKVIRHWHFVGSDSTDRTFFT
jgi:hypothetical protein